MDVKQFDLDLVNSIDLQMTPNGLKLRTTGPPENL